MTKDKKKKDNVRYMDVEFNVSMHCNDCERKIARVISKFKGVETFVTDMINHKVVVRGKIDPNKLLKKLKKKTGKRVKIVVKEEKGDQSMFGFCDWEMEKFMVFSDENVKAICSIS
ncbi:unnamed protein product [Arabidopsis thaliana]|nr:unnamed protein product [Arabidopsis thaliana]